MSVEKPRHGPARRTFRWCRRLFYLVVLLFVSFVVRLNQVGLPEFAKQSLLAQLRERGLELDFSRMRLRFGRGVVVEHVNVSRKREIAGEQVHAEELQLRLRWSELLHLRVPEITALTLRDGRITLLLPEATGRPPFPFSIDQVQARIRFVGAELWEFEELDAVCHGGTFHARGALTNASVLRSIRPRPFPPDGGTEGWRRELLRAAHYLERTDFPEAPELNLRFLADLRHPDRSGADLHLRAPAVSNHWGRVNGLNLHLELIATTGANAPLEAKLRVVADHVSTAWATLNGLEFKLHAREFSTNTLPAGVDWELGCRRLETPRARVAALRGSGRSERTPLPASPAGNWRISSGTNWVRLAPATSGFVSTLRIEFDRPRLQFTNDPAGFGRADVRLRVLHDLEGWRDLSSQIALSGVTSRWAQAGGAGVELDLKPRINAPATTDNWAWWSHLAPLISGSRVSVTNLDLPRLSVRQVRAELGWNAPFLTVTNLGIHVAGGTVRGDARVDVSDRSVTARALSEFDVHRISPLLTTNAARWMRQFEWRPEAPPRLEGEVGLRLPAWTNRHPDWRGEVLPTLTIASSLQATNGGFRGIPADHARGRITFTNRIWEVRGMEIRRPDGTLDFDYTGNDATKDYHFRLRSTLDPHLVLPLLETEAQRRALLQLDIGLPPLVEGDVWGRWRARERSGFDLHVAATNVTLRGEPIERIEGHASYTNRYLALRDVWIRSEGEATVPGAAFDISRQLVSFTNTTSTLPPMRVARVIGPKFTKTLSKYVFTNPPLVWLEGTVQIHEQASNDLRLEVKARDFSWWRLHGTNVSARLHLLGETIAILGLQGRFYRGSLGGDLHFDWSTPHDTRFKLALDGISIELADLLRDLSLATNRLEGRLTARVVSQGGSADLNTLGGFGKIRLRDGYLWGLPIFGLFSPLFDALSPGLGRTRFTDGSATFQVTNSVLTTRDMEMRSPTMRLQYRGSMDASGRLDATMEAQLFRDLPLIGRVLQFAFTPFTKLLEYRVRGTATKPEPEPRYVPRFLLIFLRPISTLKNLLPHEEKPAAPGILPLLPAPIPPPP